MNIRGTDFILFQASDIGRAARFYREILGLPQEVLSKEHNWAEFDCGNVTLSIQGAALAEGAKGGGRIAVAVDDVRAASEELRASGVSLVTEPVDYGCCQALEVPDPDGNVIILHHRADGTFGPS